MRLRILIKVIENLQRWPLQALHGFRVSLHGSVVSLHGSSVSRLGSNMSLHSFDADLVPAFYFDTDSGPDPALHLGTAPDRAK